MSVAQSQIVQANLHCGGSVKVTQPSAAKKGTEEGQPEIINLSDEDENGVKKVPEGGENATPNNNNSILPKAKTQMVAPRGRPPNNPRIIRVPISSQELRKHNQTGQAPRIIIKQIPKQGGPPQTVTVMQPNQGIRPSQAVTMTKAAMQKGEIPGLTNAKILSALKKGPAGQTITIVRHPNSAGVRNQVIRPAGSPGQFMKRVVFSGPRPNTPLIINTKAASQAGMQIIPISKPGPANVGVATEPKTILLPTRVQVDGNGSAKAENGPVEERVNESPPKTDAPNVPVVPAEQTATEPPTVSPSDSQNLPMADKTLLPLPTEDAPNEILQPATSTDKPPVENSRPCNQPFASAQTNNNTFSSPPSSAIEALQSKVDSILPVSDNPPPKKPVEESPQVKELKDKVAVPNVSASPHTITFDTPPISVSFGTSFSQNLTSIPTSLAQPPIQEPPRQASPPSISISKIPLAPPATQVPTTTGESTSVLQSGPTSNHSSSSSSPNSAGNASFIRMPDFIHGSAFSSSESKFEDLPASSGGAFGGPLYPGHSPSSSLPSPSFVPSPGSIRPPMAGPTTTANSGPSFGGSLFTDSNFSSRPPFSLEPAPGRQLEPDSARTLNSIRPFSGLPFSGVPPGLSSGLATSAPPQTQSVPQTVTPSTTRTTYKSQSVTGSRGNATSAAPTSSKTSAPRGQKRSSKNAQKDSSRVNSNSNEKSSEPTVSKAPAVSSTTSAGVANFSFTPSLSIPSTDTTPFPIEPPLRSFGDESYRPPEPIGFPQERPFGMYDQNYYPDTGGYSYGMPNQYPSFPTVPYFGDQGPNIYDSPTYHHLGAPYSNQLQPLDQRSSPGFSCGFNAGTSSNHSYLPNFETLTAPKYNESSNAGTRQPFPNMQFTPRPHFLSPLPASQSVNSNMPSASPTDVSQNYPSYPQPQMGFPASPTQALANIFSAPIP